MKQNTILLVKARLRSAGVSIYIRNDKTIIRSAFSQQPQRRTKKQFDVRQRRAHTSRIWHYIKRICSPLMTGDVHPYYRFCSLSVGLPVVYLTESESCSGSALLLPGIPVSYGTLPPVDCRLGEVDGQPALLSDLTPQELLYNPLLLVEVRQWFDGHTPRLVATAETIHPDATTLVDGCLALAGSRFGDDDCGWALVRCHGIERSTQTLVTRSTRYLSYLGDEALQRAALSYGGLTPSPLHPGEGA